MDVILATPTMEHVEDLVPKQVQAKPKPTWLERIDETRLTQIAGLVRIFRYLVQVDERDNEIYGPCSDQFFHFGKFGLQVTVGCPAEERVIEKKSQNGRHGAECRRTT